MNHNQATPHIPLIGKATPSCDILGFNYSKFNLKSPQNHAWEKAVVKLQCDLGKALIIILKS